jgi:predicted nucleic acid-binding protein
LAFSVATPGILNSLAGSCRSYAHLHIPDRRNEVDALIAATALICGLAVVTRNDRCDHR